MVSRMVQQLLTDRQTDTPTNRQTVLNIIAPLLCYSYVADNWKSTYITSTAMQYQYLRG